MQRGVAYGVMAGALWGMVFLVPRVLPDFSPLLLSAGRYTMYGIVSLAAALPMARSLVKRLTREDLGALVKLALAGNLLYYLLLTAAVHMIGIAPASLIVGVLPVTVTLLGRRDHGAVPLARLAWPLALVVAGIVCINIDVFTVADSTPVSIATKLLGLGLRSRRARLLDLVRGRKRPLSAAPDAFQRQRVVGTVGRGDRRARRGVVAGGRRHAVWQPAGRAGDGRWHTFWMLNLGLAVGASWLGNGLWNAASKRLPLTLSGQMIVFETLFALLYAFIYDQRLPRPLEMAAILLLVAGVCWSVRQHADDDTSGAASLEEKAQPSVH